MIGPFATRIFRIVFLAAGFYNLAFGLWAGFFPLSFFELFDIAPPRYPAIWSCLGMVVGLYGLLYLYAAGKPDRGRAIIAVGLLGKVLGPIGMAMNISAAWPARLAMLNVFNDAIWWLPFLLFLIRGTFIARRLEKWPPWICAVLHVLGVVAVLLVLQSAIATQTDVVRRATYIAQHPTAWSMGWIVWMLSALSLVVFYAWWGCRLAHPIVATIAVLFTAMGSVCDFAGESYSSLVLVERSQPLLSNPSQFDAAAFVTREWYVTFLSAGPANMLYVIAGAMLTLCTKNLPRPIQLAMWATWIAGTCMTVAFCADNLAVLEISTAILFPLLLSWIIWMGLRWRPRF